MTLTTDEKLAAAREIAQNMVDLAAKIDAGTAAPIEPSDYFDYDLCDVLHIVRSAGFDTEGAYYRTAPTPDQNDALAAALGPDAPTLDALYEAGSKIIPFAAKNAWAKMVETEFEPDASYYLAFHARIGEIDIDPQSDGVLTFLDVTRDAFKRVDQAHALNAIYEDFGNLTDPMMLTLTRISIEDRAKTSDVPVDVTEAFITSARKQTHNMAEDMQRTAAQSGLTEEQVFRYMEMRNPDLAKGTAGTLDDLTGFDVEVLTGGINFVKGPGGVQ